MSFCYCQSPGTEGKFMIQCDYCENWFHGDCLDPIIAEEEAEYYIKFHCKECETIRGPSIYRPPIRKSVREKPKVVYKDLHNGGKGLELRFTKLLISKEHVFKPNNFKILKGYELTKTWMEQTGFREPVIIPDPIGNFDSVSDVADSCGRDTTVDVLYVPTQSERIMTLDEWAKYFEQPEGVRTGILNVITLEISEYSIGKLVKRPTAVCEIDWIDHVWPAEIKPIQYPKVQLYCLMSVKDSYTDFHIDFGGSSVFYHILSGEKIFYFIEPTPQNLKKYELWTSNSSQGEIFFGETVPNCYKVHLTAGNTMLIPTGWIHAVFTPSDSIVIGGNFLHGYNIKGQLDIYEIEKKTMVPPKFRFPYFDTMLWYAAKTYLCILKDDPDSISDFTLEGLYPLAKYLLLVTKKLTQKPKITKEERRRIRESIPKGLKNIRKLAKSLKRTVKVELKGRFNALIAEKDEEVQQKNLNILYNDNPIQNLFNTNFSIDDNFSPTKIKNSLKSKNNNFIENLSSDSDVNSFDEIEDSWDVEELEHENLFKEEANILEDVYLDEEEDPGEKFETDFVIKKKSLFEKRKLSRSESEESVSPTTKKKKKIIIKKNFELKIDNNNNVTELKKKMNITTNNSLNLLNYNNNNIFEAKINHNALQLQRMQQSNNSTTISSNSFNKKKEKQVKAPFSSKGKVFSKLMKGMRK
ncbi:Lysine-specific demethylase 7A [Clydaea vesicula]|uniref:JmjC domain-containing histone demethylation protein 1 n=1 Tax=Clydaea vesicula TaxID=447962 RepID=A0AAD5U7A5_9FUNG|nr:Lysine-specific demethylase 7A [Clydaea vesicula]